MAALYEQAAAVPCERRAVLAGGLRGAAKIGALATAAVDPGRYFRVSIDLVLAELARRSLIPVVAGLSPMEGADLVHTEARHIAKRLAVRAIADGRNLLLDVTMGSEPSVRSWLVNLGLAVYTVQVVIAAIDGEDAVRWTEAQHRQGHENYTRGHGNGGRIVPAEAIRVAGVVAAALARSNWTTIQAWWAYRRHRCQPPAAQPLCKVCQRDPPIAVGLRQRQLLACGERNVLLACHMPEAGGQARAG